MSLVIREYLWRLIGWTPTAKDSLDALAGLSNVEPIDGESIDDVVYG